MKIVAVRGKNLASLAGHFEVDLRKPPLDRAGLIAITGATGAGKTTLLDAMCLALFDRTPRFGNRGGVIIGAAQDEPGLRATDVRGILRHGTVEGWAEVDFIGADERLWRSRWEVRRARGRADGRIQAQQMRLIDPLTNQTIAADRKSDTLAAIEARLGLDFDQFRRSVLLAQGEFSAFLEASGGERAELLERMTGTGLYRQLGRGAFERAKLAERERDDLLRERERLQLLAPEERARLESAAAAKREAQVVLERDRLGLEAARRWYQTSIGLTRALAEARAELEGAREREQALREREVLLAQVERVSAVRERIAARDQWVAQLDERRRDLAFVRGELPLIEAQRLEQDAQVGACEGVLVRAREHRRRIGPELDRARELDTKLVGAVEQRGRSQVKLTAAVSARDQAGAGLEHIGAELASAEANLARALAWVEAHVSLAPLAEHWPHYRSLLQQQQRWLENEAKARARLAQLAPRLERGFAALGSATRERTAARKRRGQARSRLQKIERELDARPALAQLRHRQHELDACRERQGLLRGIFESFTRGAKSAQELETERGEQELERDHRRSELRRVEAELGRAQGGFEEAQRGLRTLEALRDLVEHRVQLRGGEACPVCGSTEHPAAAAAAPEDAIVGEQRERVDRQLRERDDLQREQGEHQGREQLASQRLVQIARRLAEQAKVDAGLQRDWSEGLAEGPLLPEDEEDEHDEEDDDDDDEEDEQAGQLSLLGAPMGRGGELTLPERLASSQLGPALWTVHDELDRRARTLAREREEVESLLEQQRARRARRDEAQELLEVAGERVEQCARELDTLTRERDETVTRLEALAVDIETRWTELEDVVPATLDRFEPPLEGFAPAHIDEAPSSRFRRGFGDHGATLITRLASATTRFSQQRSSSEQSREGVRTLAARRAELATQHRARLEVCAELEAELAELEAASSELERERAAVLDGRPVAELVRELEAALELAERDRERSKDALAKAERELQAQRTRVHTLAEQVEALELRGREADALVDAALADAALDAAHVEELLARAELWTEDWSLEARRFVDATRAELERLRAVVGERERVMLEHGEGGAPELGEVEVGPRQAELDADALRLRRELFELEHPLRRDREDRSLAEALAPRLAECQRNARVWGRLRDAIGTATGDKFQKFAQSLTLEILLAEANAQLRQLKPRYALSRVPNHDLELQLVDHDLGDEIRSIRGLSGGEKFLVSLALALALAGLSSEDCRIESLFIDEGFGTLDAHSLDIAVSTLDALQAEGRQIGVISHVPGLAERIGVEIRVETVSSGRSRIRVRGPT